MDAAGEVAVVIGVDTGGTFTDVFASSGAVRKVASTPRTPSAAILEGLRAAGMTSRDAVGHGTTVATNAVLERTGARTALITTAGFEDVLEIRRQNRPSLYDLEARWPDPIVPTVFRLGVNERLDHRGEVLKSLDEREVNELGLRLRDAGIESVAVCLLFAYANPIHELGVVRLLRDVLGSGVPITASHVIAPQYGEYERSSTTAVNAYVVPLMRTYLRALEEELECDGVRSLHVMQSNGGLVSAQTAGDQPVHTVLSGPAAGVVGAHALASQAGYSRIITFDMGGTSTDVAVVPGAVLESGEGEIASFPLLIPMLTIETVGAGGGSIARVDAGGGLHVGPRSAGADPGPAAYGTGTMPTVTDANLILGRLAAGGLLGGTMPLNADRSHAALEPIAQRLELTVEQAAWAVVRLANSNMERAVRTVTLQRGYDPRRFTLFSFGGAGPVHAAELATDLGIERVLVPPHPGVMAALGLTIPDLQRDFSRTVLCLLQPGTEEDLATILNEIEETAVRELEREELFGEPRFHRWADLRYVGQSFDLRIPFVADQSSLLHSFSQAYEERYGYTAPDGLVEVVNLRLRATLPRRDKPRFVPNWPEQARPEEEREIWFGSSVGARDVSPLSGIVRWRPSLDRGTVEIGPAVLEQYDSTTIVPPGWRATVDDTFNLVLTHT